MNTEIMKTWNNGDSAEVVKKVIEENFNILFARTNKTAPVANNIYSKTFIKSDWNDGLIIINQSEHKISKPIPQLFILTENRYLSVCGGVCIDSQNNIILQSDMPFDGKVVIK